MSERQEANSIVERHVVWAVSAGLLPVPVADMAAVGAVQLDMLRQLASQYDVEYTEDLGKMFVASVAGVTVSSLGARVGSSLLKAIPVIGPALGGLSLSAMSGASTFALGQAAIRHLEEHQNFLGIDVDHLKRVYRDKLAQGKEFVSGLGKRGKGARRISQSLKELGELRDLGVITEEEFEARKNDLLDSI